MKVDSPALNESQAQARASLALLCHQMLNGELSFFEGAIQVCALRFSVGVPEFDPDLRGSTLNPDFRPFSESAFSTGAGFKAMIAKVLWWHVCNSHLQT